MKITKILAGTLLMLASAGYAQQINPLTQALLSSYAEILKQDPKDYVTLYQRAMQYLQMQNYDEALADVGNAIKYTPEKEKDTKSQEYALLAEVAIAKKQYTNAIEAIDRALSYTPNNYALLYRKGEAALMAADTETAEKAFKSMLGIKSRSQDAFYGLAQAAIMKQDYSKAEELMKELENTDLNSWITYSRLGDLFSMMGNTKDAATDYVVSYSLAEDSSRPLQSLFGLASKDYPGVKDALENAAKKSNNEVMLNYLLAYISHSTGHYEDAADVLDALLLSKEGQQPEVYNLKAANDLKLGNNQEAIESASKAMGGAEDISMLILKSDAFLQNDQPASALVEAKKALAIDPNSVGALTAAAKASIAAKDGKGAIEYLNELVMIDPGNIEPLFLRGYVYTELENNGKQGAADYIRASNMDAEGFPAVAYKALAKAKAGKKIDADSIMEKALAGNNDKNACYYAAVYYAQSGSLEKAEEMIKKAISLGYDNQYNLKKNKFCNFNISPIRHLL